MLPVSRHGHDLPRPRGASGTMSCLCFGSALRTPFPRGPGAPWDTEQAGRRHTTSHIEEGTKQPD